MNEHEDYRRVLTPPEPLEPCPLCGADAEMWDFSTSFTAPQTHVVSCPTAADLGPRESPMYPGCLLYMGPLDFHRSTRRDAARYWNEYARAVVALREANEAARARKERASCGS